MANMNDRGHPRVGGLNIGEMNMGAYFTIDEIEFGQAVFEYRRRHQVAFPPLSDLLKILRSLGYRKIARRGPLP